MIPVSRPTSQYGPCSDPNKIAVSQKAIGEYVPSGTRLKSLLINHRISQPRQNNSSTTGTMSTARMLRHASTHGSCSDAGCMVECRCPTSELENHMLCRYPGISTSGAIQSAKTAAPTGMDGRGYAGLRESGRGQQTKHTAPSKIHRSGASQRTFIGILAAASSSAMKTTNGAMYRQVA